MEDPQEVIAHRILEAMLPGCRNASSSTITVHNEGRGTWIAVTACLMMLVLNVVLGVLYLDLSRKLDRMQDHLSAIYMIAPSLKPKE